MNFWTVAGLCAAMLVAVLVVLDDMGFAQLGCFGSGIATPNIDRLADNGLRYNRFHVTAEFTKGQFTAIMGPSGSGKSTLISALLGLPPYSGRIEVDGDVISDLRDCAAWSPQNPSLLSGTVLSNITLGATGVNHNALQRAMKLAALDDLDLDNAIGENSAGISGGQAQRVSLARAFSV